MSKFIEGFKFNVLTNPDTYNNFEKTSYYLGKTVRVGLAVPGTLADFTLQAFQSLVQSFEMLATKAECVLTSSSRAQTSSYQFFNSYSLSNLAIPVRYLITKKEPTLLARALGIVAEEEVLPDFSMMYRFALIQALFPQN